jgi:hypothetical protein
VGVGRGDTSFFFIVFFLKKKLVNAEISKRVEN